MRPAHLDPTDARVEAGVFGKEVEAFIRSPVGAHLVQKAEREIHDAIEKLKDVDPTDEAQIRTLQSAIKRAESIQGWLGEAIAEGEAAIQSLEGEEDAHGEE